MQKSQTILLVDPETDFLEWAQHQLETPNTRVVTATNADEAFKHLLPPSSPICSSPRPTSCPSAASSCS